MSAYARRSRPGFLAECFLRNGNPVFGVEPHCEMREAGEQLLQAYPQFRSCNGTAEATDLPPHSVRFVTAGQAFHWFNPTRARLEFARILQPKGWVVLVGNEQCIDTTPLLQTYEQQQTYGIDYESVAQRQRSETVLAGFFGPGGFRTQVVANQPRLDYASLEGRLLSSSYMPLAGHSGYASMLAELRQIFDRYQIQGQVKLEYDIHLIYGRLS